MATIKQLQEAIDNNSLDPSTLSKEQYNAVEQLIEEGKIEALLEEVKETKDVSLDEISDYLDPENLEKIEQKASETPKNPVN